MKTKLVLGSLLALTSMVHAQNTFPSPGNVGIGTISPAYPLDVQTSANAGYGIRIKNTNASGGEATLRMDATTPGGRQYALHSIGNGWGTGFAAGSFMIRDESVYPTPEARFFIDGPTGYVGIGTTTPAMKLDVSSAIVNDGIAIHQTGSGAAALHMDNQTTGGKHWTILSTGYSNYPQNAGNFDIIDWTSNKDRFFISGSTGNVGIGNINPANGRLEVTADPSYASTTGIYATAYNVTSGSTLNTGIEGRAGGNGICLTGTSYGVVGRAYNSNINYGGFFEGINNNGCLSTNYGLYASGNYRAAYFAGSVEYSGSLYATSDRKLKDNIAPLENALDKIKLLKPSTYNYKVDEFKDMNLPAGQQMGLIAQELEEVFPGLVINSQEVIHKNEKGEITSNLPAHKSVNYMSLIPVLIAGMQEQQQQIADQTKANSDLKAQLADQQKQLDEQKALIDELSQKVSGTATGINSNQAIETGFQMSQNEPNPYTHETVVKYTLPQTIGSAYMAVYDLTGKQITSFPIEQKGSAAITITSEKLAAGIYIYSIVADGKVMDSKRMIVSGK